MAGSKWLAVLVLPLLTASCGPPSDPHSGIGVGSQVGSSRVGVAYLPCADERVTSVELATNPASGSGTVLWQISSGPTAAASTQFILGESPPGWLAAVPMAELPSKSERLAVYVATTKRSPGGISFTIGDLVPGAIMSDDGLVSREDFVGSQDYC